MPDVQTIATGLCVCCAIPIAINAALRSSTMTCFRMLLHRVNAMIIGALREPGETTTSFTPYSWSKSTKILHDSCVVVSVSFDLLFVFIRSINFTPKLAKICNICIILNIYSDITSEIKFVIKTKKCYM